MELNATPKPFLQVNADEARESLLLPRESLSNIYIAAALNKAARDIYAAGDEDRATSLLNESRHALLDGLVKLFTLRGSANLIVISDSEDITSLRDEVNDILTDFMPF